MKKPALNRPFVDVCKRLRRQRVQQQRQAAEPLPPPAPMPPRVQRFADFAAASTPAPITPLVARSRRVPPPRQLATAVVPAGPPCVEHTYALLRREGYIEGRRDDVDVAELNWLRGAQPGFELDLHGMLAEPARSRLHRVIMGQHQRGEHVLLVVVGKGLHSPHGHAVLRENVLLWLVDARIAPFVRAFVSARPNHGGHGSLYVCIRP